MSTRPNYQDLLNAATASAADHLAELVADFDRASPDLATRIVEQVIEAATARVFLRLETEGARRRRLEAVDVLRPNLCGACVELLDPEPEAEAVLGVGDEDVAGSCELAERMLFLGWAGRVERLTHDGEGQTYSEDDDRFQLIVEIHASVAARHPLGIAESLYRAIGALHVGDDRDAQLALEDLALAEFGAAMREKAEGVLGALRVLVDPELDEERAREELKTWTLEELVLVEAWAEQAYKAATSEATIPIKPAVVAALERELSE